MKKQFFYAALMVAMMTACSDNVDEVATAGEEPQAPIENPGDFAEDGNYQIKLGVVAPRTTANVTTRGTGMVGNTSNSLWNAQKVKVVMYECEYDQASQKYNPTNKFAKEEINNEQKDIMSNVEFVTPTGDSQEKMSGLRARYIVPPTAEGGNDSYEWVKYYPLQGVFAFYGYYLDDIDATDPEDNKDKLVTNITIDGANDVMAAQTIPFTSNVVPTADPATDASASWDYYYTQLPGFSDLNMDGDTWNLVAKRSFSAWSARRNIQPILQFKHLLSQFTFEVIAGQESAKDATNESQTDLYEYEGASTSSSQEANAMNTGVRINDIYVTGAKDQFDMKLDGSNMSVSTTDALITDAYIQNATVSAADKNLYLTTLPTGSTELSPNTTLVQLSSDQATAIYPENVKNGDEDEYTKVGESLMLLPGEKSFTFYVSVTQNVPYKVDPTDETKVIAYVTKEAVLPVTVNFSDITRPEGDNTTGESFIAGESYKIQLVIYGFQKIEMYAMLQDWKEGGSTNVTPEDDWFEQQEKQNN